MSANKQQDEAPPELTDSQTYVGKYCTTCSVCSPGNKNGTLKPLAKYCFVMSPLLIGFIVLLVFTIDMENEFLLNTHYSAKTLHVFKKNHERSSSSWNSLGTMSPYIEQQVL
jgi:hypothetical protein